MSRKGKSTEEKKQYQTRFLKIRERKPSEEKKPINLVIDGGRSLK